VLPAGGARPSGADVGHAMSTRKVQFLIFASPKSGTTWMQRLLSAHPDVHCGETRLFGRHVDPARPSGLGITLESYVSNLQRHFHPPAASEGDAPFERALLFDLADQIARTTLGRAGKRIYGEKQTPYLGTAARVLEQLQAYDPDIRLIHLVRDGRDVVVSGAAQWANLTKSSDAALAPAAAGVDERHFAMFLRHWVEAAEAFARYRDGFGHCLVVRYEDLLQDTAGEVRRVLGFIGAGDADATIRACVDAASFERLSGGRARGEEDRASFFRKGVEGDWRRLLSADQIARFEREAAAWLRAYGYALSSTSD
jgi:hypothetical protein